MSLISPEIQCELVPVGFLSPLCFDAAVNSVSSDKGWGGGLGAQAAALVDGERLGMNH